MGGNEKVLDSHALPHSLDATQRFQGPVLVVHGAEGPLLAVGFELHLEDLLVALLLVLVGRHIHT